MFILSLKVKQNLPSRPVTLLIKNKKKRYLTTENSYLFTCNSITKKLRKIPSEQTITNLKNTKIIIIFDKLTKKYHWKKQSK